MSPFTNEWIDSLEKTLMLGGIWGQEKKRTTEDEMAGWHHGLDGHEFGWTLGVGDGQGGLGCCDSWSRRVGHDWATELNWTELILRYVPSIPAFWRVFIINGCWILSKVFSASIEKIIWLLFFNLLMSCITLIDLRILKNPCIPGIKPTWSWCMIFLMCCWILIARILLRIFASMFISNIGL